MTRAILATMMGLCMLVGTMLAAPAPAEAGGRHRHHLHHRHHHLHHHAHGHRRHHARAAAPGPAYGSRPALLDALLGAGRRALASVGRFEGELARVPAPLADKVHEVVAACGSRVVIVNSGHTLYVAGTRKVSLHRLYEAVDVAGNPACIYAHLSRWPGGYSTDYGTVGHVHVSYAPQSREWGSRFVHGGHSRRHFAGRHRRVA